MRQHSACSFFLQGNTCSCLRLLWWRRYRQLLDGLLKAESTAVLLQALDALLRQAKTEPRRWCSRLLSPLRVCDALRAAVWTCCACRALRGGGVLWCCFPKGIQCG